MATKKKTVQGHDYSSQEDTWQRQHPDQERNKIFKMYKKKFGNKAGAPHPQALARYRRLLQKKDGTFKGKFNKQVRNLKPAKRASSTKTPSASPDGKITPKDVLRLIERLIDKM